MEIKIGQMAKPEWFRWLGQMRRIIADKFMTGIALYSRSALTKQLNASRSAHMRQPPRTRMHATQ